MAPVGFLVLICLFRCLFLCKASDEAGLRSEYLPGLHVFGYQPGERSHRLSFLFPSAASLGCNGSSIALRTDQRLVRRFAPLVINVSARRKRLVEILYGGQTAPKLRHQLSLMLAQPAGRSVQFQPELWNGSRFSQFSRTGSGVRTRI